MFPVQSPAAASGLQVCLAFGLFAENMCSCSAAPCLTLTQSHVNTCMLFSNHNSLPNWPKKSLVTQLGGWSYLKEQHKGETVIDLIHLIMSYKICPPPPKTFCYWLAAQDNKKSRAVHWPFSTYKSACASEVSPQTGPHTTSVLVPLNCLAFSAFISVCRIANSATDWP